MAVATMDKRQGKKQKKSGVLTGKIEKKNSKVKSKPDKQFEQVKTKLNNEKASKKLKKFIQEDTAVSSPPLNKKLKKEISQKVDHSQQMPNNEGFSAKLKKLEKKDKLNMLKRAKNPNKVAEVVTNISSGRKDKKKKSKKDKKAGEEEVASDIVASQSQAEKQEKKKVVKSEEEQERIKARRIEKLKIWQFTIDFVLKKPLPKDQIELISKSRKYPKLPLWKKPYISWVKTDPKYKDQKHASLIKKVYKVLKSAERKVKRNKLRESKQLKPQTPKTQAAIDRCVQMTTSQGADSPVAKVEENEMSKAAAKQKKARKDKKVFKEKKEIENKSNVENEAVAKQSKQGKAKNLFFQKKEGKKLKEISLGKKNKPKFVKKA